MLRKTIKKHFFFRIKVFLKLLLRNDFQECLKEIHRATLKVLFFFTKINKFMLMDFVNFCFKKETYFNDTYSDLIHEQYVWVSYGFLKSVGRCYIRAFRSSYIVGFFFWRHKNIIRNVLLTKKPRNKR